jgi:hypothetical protein
VFARGPSPSFFWRDIDAPVPEWHWSVEKVVAPLSLSARAAPHFRARKGDCPFIYRHG